MRFGALLWPASAAAVLVVALPILGSLGSTAARFDAAAAAVRPAALTDPAAVTAAKTNGRPLPAVVAAVRAAQRGAHLPSQLTPSVSTLKKDVWHFPKGCIPTPESTSSNLCRIGDLNAKKTMVVFGDSHAQMWMPTLLRLAARESWTIIPVVKASCIPRRWAEPGKCNVWYRWARQHAAALHPQVTLIVASWANAYGPGLAVKPIGAISRAMKRSSLSVIVVGDAPGQSQDPVDCLLAPGANMKTCTTTARRSQLRADDLIASNAKRDGVGFINTRGWFCARVRRSPDTLCPLVVNQTITAIDRGHISQTYGLELVPSFRAAFRRALFGYA